MSYTFNDLEELKSWLNENVEEAWTADGLDEAIIGIVDMPGSQPVILYDKDLCVAAIMRSHGCDADTAVNATARSPGFRPRARGALGVRATSRDGAG